MSRLSDEDLLIGGKLHQTSGLITCWRGYDAGGLLTQETMNRGRIDLLLVYEEDPKPGEVHTFDSHTRVNPRIYSNSPSLK
jgi:hypothetical protein